MGDFFYFNKKYYHPDLLHSARLAFTMFSKSCRAVILVSGTLSPMSYVSSELDTPFDVTLEAPHVIDAEKQVGFAWLTRM
jgi:Rad3-related DNA helicase